MNGENPLAALDAALGDDNLALAEAVAQEVLTADPANGYAAAAMAHVARLIRMDEVAARWRQRADPAALSAMPDPNDENVRSMLAGCGASPHDERFLVIRAWGYGFWADATHVLGALMLAELSGRIPCALWGANSLFLPDGEDNAFPLFFNGIGGEFLSLLAKAPADEIFPAKWRGDTLGGPAVDPQRAPHSGGSGRMAAIWLLNRPERVVVSDFFVGVADLLPWIPPGHRWDGMPLDDIVRELIVDRLVPNWRIRDLVAEACARLEGRNTLAVHIRGGDKGVELSRLGELNAHYAPIVEQAVGRGYAVWLMTDTKQVVADFETRFGDAVDCQDAMRTADTTGVHYGAAGNDRVRAGEEVVTDVLVGAGCDRFLGNGASAPSCIVDFLMEGDETRKHLFLPNQYRRRLLSLYRD